MNNDKKFYLKMTLILAVVFLVWVFGEPKNELPARDNGDYKLKGKPAALTNFVLPTFVVFDDGEDTLPRRNWSAPPLELNAEAAIAVKSDGNRVYYNKNIEKRRKIASLTKLMTALVVLENYDLDEIIKIPSGAIKREGSQGNLRPDEQITTRSLLDIMLVDSSNDAAIALAETRSDFVTLMNKKAKTLDLTDTHFSNPDGLDEQNNYSSALDVAKIFSYLTNTYPEIFEILKTKNMVVYSSDGKIEHRLKNTNELLGRVSEVVAGKTGYTDEAGGSLVLFISGLSFGDKNEIITVVLGSPDRFSESEKLIQWLKEAYIWGK